VTSGTIALSAGTAAQLTITAQPAATAQAGVAFNPPPALQLRDASGNAVSQANVTVTAALASGPTGATVTGATATTNASGVATFTGLTITGPVGSYAVGFSSGTLTGVTSGTIALSAGTAAQLTITAQPAATAQAGVA